MYNTHTHCRCCGSTKLTSYINLGDMPLANNLQPTHDNALSVERFPLQVMLCDDCGLSQLSIVVDPAIMFSNYNYRSSVNGGYLKHCYDMAVEFKEKYNLHTSDKEFGSFVIDIAGNDGALLSQFTKAIPGLKHLNIDPASNLASVNEAAGIRQYCKFWNMETAESLQGLGWPKADLIAATNVFAHVDDCKGFLKACVYALKDTGVLVLEFPYIADFINNNEFDTVYHEHLSYMSVKPVERMLNDAGLFIHNISKFEIHGGTIRIEAGKQRSAIGDRIAHGYIEAEEVIDYTRFAKYVNQTILEFEYGLDVLRDHKVAAFAASAKGCTLLNSIHDASVIQYIVDETPEKIEKFTPGTGIEVVPLVHLLAFPVDYLIILSWNFFFEIATKCRKAGYKGKFIVPIPKWRIIDEV